MNAIIIGLETDFPDKFAWDIVENIFLVLFTLELVTQTESKRSYWRGLENNQYDGLTPLIHLCYDIPRIHLEMTLESFWSTYYDPAAGPVSEYDFFRAAASRNTLRCTMPRTYVGHVQNNDDSTWL